MLQALWLAHRAACGLDTILDAVLRGKPQRLRGSSAGPMPRCIGNSAALALPERGAGKAQQFRCILFRAAWFEDGRACDQHLRSCLDDGGDRIVSDAAIDLDAEVEAHLLAQLGEVGDLVDRERAETAARQSRG